MPLTPVIEGALDLLLPLQTPAYADPITLLYSNQPALPVLTRNCSRTGGRKAGPPCTAQADFSYHNYNWIPQVPGGSPQGEKPGPFHAEALYSVGFHVGVPAPAARAGVLYSTGTGPDSYAYATRARHGQQDLQLGQDAVAHFRDSLVVFPEDTAAPGTARKAPWMPSNPTTRRQGDQDLVLRMADAAAPDARYVEVGVAQGSPFAQLEVRGVPRLVVGAVFPAAKVPSGPAHPAQLAGNASQPDPTTPLRVRVEGPNGGSVMVQMVYQQVGFGFENIVDPTRPGSSVWASTAVIWDPDVWGTAGLQGPVQGGPDYEAGSRYYWMSPQDPARPAHLVLAPLASQLANLPRGAGRPQYDLAAAAKWAQALAPFAFNFHSGASRVDMYQGESPSGDSARPNEVHVVWTPALVARGPAAVSATTSKPLAVSLLQPIHYLTTFKDGRNGTMPLQLATHFEPGSPWAARVAEGDGPFLQFGGERVAAKYNKYWVSRGVLEAYVSDAVHCSFVAPASVPFFPSQVHAPQQPGTDYVKTGAAPNDDVDFKLNDLLYVLISSAGYELATGTDTGPAASKMGVEMNEPYGAGQAAYYTAKMLHQLRGLQEPSDRPAWFPAANPDCSADCIRQREELEGGLMGSLRDFFALWWEEQPGPKLLSQDGVSSSFTYAMYDNTTHHLTLFPAGTAAVEGQPQSVQAGLLTVDAFGVATKLSDHHYAYGYHIAAAALLGLAEQAALGGSAHPPDRLWHTRDRWGPLVDMLIQDIAFVRSLHEGRDVEWWVDEDHFRFPRLENMDTWTGGVGPAVASSGGVGPAVASSGGVGPAVASSGSGPSMGEAERNALGLAIVHPKELSRDFVTFLSQITFKPVRGAVKSHISEDHFKIWYKPEVHKIWSSHFGNVLTVNSKRAEVNEAWTAMWNRAKAVLEGAGHPTRQHAQVGQGRHGGYARHTISINAVQGSGAPHGRERPLAGTAALPPSRNQALSPWQTGNFPRRPNSLAARVVSIEILDN